MKQKLNHLLRKLKDIKERFCLFCKYELPRYSIILFFTILLLIVFTVVSMLDYYVDKEFSWHEILVEAHGLVLDIIILGLGLSIFEYFRGKKDQIENLLMKIEDFRNWESEEAKHRIMGCVNRLIDLGVYIFNLNGCYLVSADFSDTDYSNSTFMFAKLDMSNFTRSNLTSCSFIGAQMTEVYCIQTVLNNTNFMGANMRNSKFTSVNIANCNFMNSDLANAELIDCIIMDSNLTNINLENAVVDLPNWIELLLQQNIIGFEYINRTFAVDIASERRPDGYSIYNIKRV